MPLGFFLLFFFLKNTVKSIPTGSPLNASSPTIPATTEEVQLSPLKVVAAPDYPVAAGQTVSLHCSASIVPASVTWSWQHLENMTWREVSSSRDVTLTEPKQSGIYRCYAERGLSQRVSRNLTVFIIAMQRTAGENLGIAAFVLILPTLIITLTILCWLGRQRFGDKLTTSNTAKGFPGPEKTPKGDLPQTESDGDVYMNYTGTNQAYSDLDPTNMTGDNVYSSLS